MQGCNRGILQADRQKRREKLFVRAIGLSGQGGWNPGGSFQYVADVVLGSDLDGASHSPPSSALKTDLAQRRMSLLDAWIIGQLFWMLIGGATHGLFLRGKSLPRSTIRATLMSTFQCAILLVVAGRGSDTAVLLFWGTGCSVSPDAPVPHWHRVDVRMCSDRRSTEAGGNRNGSSRASPVQTFDICSVYFRLEGGFASLG